MCLHVLASDCRCGHCKKLAPDYEKFGTAFKKTKSVNIAKVSHRSTHSTRRNLEYDNLLQMKRQDSTVHSLSPLLPFPRLTATFTRISATSTMSRASPPSSGSLRSPPPLSRKYLTAVTRDPVKSKSCLILSIISSSAVSLRWCRYQGGRELEDLIGFVNGKLGEYCDFPRSGNPPCSITGPVRHSNVNSSFKHHEFVGNAIKARLEADSAVRGWDGISTVTMPSTCTCRHEREGCCGSLRRGCSDPRQLRQHRP